MDWSKFIEWINGNSTILTFMGVVVSVISVVVAIVIGIITNRARREKRKIEYTVQSINDVLIEKKIKNNSKITLQYGDKPINMPVLITLVIRNVGDTFIKKDDFIRPFTISFNNKILVIESKATLEGTANYEIESKRQNDNLTIELEKSTLNPKDCITVQIIGDIKDDITPEDIKVEPHIDNVSKDQIKKINALEDKSFSNDFMITLNLIPLGGIIAFAVGMAIGGRIEFGKTLAALGFIIAGFSPLVIIPVNIFFFTKELRKK